MGYHTKILEFCPKGSSKESITSFFLGVGNCAGVIVIGGKTMGDLFKWDETMHRYVCQICHRPFYAGGLASHSKKHKNERLKFEGLKQQKLGEILCST